MADERSERERERRNSVVAFWAAVGLGAAAAALPVTIYAGGLVRLFRRVAGV